MIPVLDRARFLHAMRENEAHRNIPSIVMSSVPEASVRTASMDMPALSAIRSSSLTWSSLSSAFSVISSGEAIGQSTFICRPILGEPEQHQTGG